MKMNASLSPIRERGGLLCLALLVLGAGVSRRTRQWLWRKHGNPAGKYERWPSRELVAAYGLHRLQTTL